jgi:hypothetical protein
MDWRIGMGMYVNGIVDDAVSPPPFVTPIVWVNGGVDAVVWAGMEQMIWMVVMEMMLQLFSFVTVTVVMPGAKFVPVIVISVPDPPCAGFGEYEVIDGMVMTVKGDEAALDAKSRVRMKEYDDDADNPAEGSVTYAWVPVASGSTTVGQATPPNVTVVRPAMLVHPNPVPVSVTTAPSCPLVVGVIVLMIGLG